MIMTVMGQEINIPSRIVWRQLFGIIVGLAARIMPWVSDRLFQLAVLLEHGIIVGFLINLGVLVRLQIQMIVR